MRYNCNCTNEQVEDKLTLATEGPESDDPLNKYLDNREEGHSNSEIDRIRSKYFAEIKRIYALNDAYEEAYKRNASDQTLEAIIKAREAQESRLRQLVLTETQVPEAENKSPEKEE